MTALPVIATTVTGTVSGNNVNFAKPTVANGDMLVAAVGFRGTATLVTPTGWTKVVDQVLVGGTSPGMKVFYRVVDGTEGSTLTFATSDSLFAWGRLLQVTGVDTTTPIDQSNQGVNFASTTQSTGGKTTLVDNTLLLAFDDIWTYGTSPTINSGPSGSTQVALPTTGSDHKGAIYSKGIATAGATGGVAFNWSAPVDGISGWFTVRPTGADAGPTVNAGADQTITYGDTATVTASASDPDGTIGTYAWTIVSSPSGSTATISNASSATAGFKPDKPGAYVLRCTVTESGGSGLTASDDLTLTANAAMWVNVSGTWKAANRRVLGTVYPPFAQLRGTRTNSAAAATSLTLTQPSGAAAGDLGIIATRLTGQAMTGPSGWTAGAQAGNFSKLYDSSAASTNPAISCATPTDIVGALLVLTGVHATTPINVTAATAFSSGATFTGPSLTPTADRTLHVSTFVYVRGAAQTASITPPAGWTIVGPVQLNTLGVTVAIAYKTGPFVAGTVAPSPSWAANVAAFSASVTNYLIRPAS